MNTQKSNLHFLHIVFYFSVMVTSAVSVAASPACKIPDKDFAAFLVKFKNSRAFHEERVIYPLKEEFAGGEGIVSGTVSRDKYRKEGFALRLQKTTIVPSRTCKAQNENGQCADYPRKGVCEFPPEILGAITVVRIFDCGEESFGADYQFSLQSGCWYLSALLPYGN